MLRRRWHDVVITMGLAALLAAGVLALWGDELGALAGAGRGSADQGSPGITPGAL